MSSMRAGAEQLVFDLPAADPPSFDNFVVGHNAEAVAALALAAAGECAETGVFIWGPPGAGCSHLLAAAAAAARARGRPVIESPAAATLADDAPAPGAFAAIDDVGLAGSAAQGRLFSLYNALASSGGTLVAAASAPPAALGLRDDVRSRLAWGLVHEIVPLDDADKPRALAAWARARGFVLGDDVVAWLLARHRRDMRALVAVLESLDRRSLALRRPVTLPLLREWMQRSIDENGPD